jgi:hypothetical protein
LTAGRQATVTKVIGLVRTASTAACQNGDDIGGSIQAPDEIPGVGD